MILIDRILVGQLVSLSLYLLVIKVAGVDEEPNCLGIAEHHDCVLLNAEVILQELQTLVLTGFCLFSLGWVLYKNGVFRSDQVVKSFKD